MSELRPNEMELRTEPASGMDKSQEELDKMSIQEMTEWRFADWFDSLAAYVSADNYNKGFKDNGLPLNPLYIPTKLMLMVTELAEGVEAHRKGGIAQKDDHLPQHSALGCELADTVIRILDLAGDLKLPVGKIIFDKLAYNRSRARAHGGKAY